jgi:hypothetical protein
LAIELLQTFGVVAKEWIAALNQRIPTLQTDVELVHTRSYIAKIASCGALTCVEFARQEVCLIWLGFTCEYREQTTPMQRSGLDEFSDGCLLRSVWNHFAKHEETLLATVSSHPREILTAFVQSKWPIGANQMENVEWERGIVLFFNWNNFDFLKQHRETLHEQLLCSCTIFVKLGFTKLLANSIASC